VTNLNVFVKSIAIITRLSLFKFILCSNSFKIILYSLHSFIFLINHFWLSKKMWTLALISWIVPAIKHVNILYMQGVIEIGLNFSICAISSFLHIRIVFVSFYVLMTCPLRIYHRTNNFINMIPSVPALFMIR
jgi:hypothetical protein